VVTDRALMRFALILVFVSSAFFAAGCKQGVGDRCVQDSDYASGKCTVPGDVRGGQCVAVGTTPTGTGGTGQGGGQAGQGGASGEGGNGQGGNGPADAAQDASPATDANPG